MSKTVVPGSTADGAACGRVFTRPDDEQVRLVALLRDEYPPFRLDQGGDAIPAADDQSNRSLPRSRTNAAV